MSPECHDSKLLKGASSHGLFGNGKMTTVKVAVNVSREGGHDLNGDGLTSLVEICAKGAPSLAKGLESSNKHAGELEWSTCSTP